jgi:hypothetical protein
MVSLKLDFYTKRQVAPEETFDADRIKVRIPLPQIVNVTRKQSKRHSTTFT